jgi:hypothetical protein
MSSFSRKEFLEVLFKDYFSKRDGFIMVRTGKHLDPRVSTRFFPNTEILSKEQYQEDQNVFFGVCPRETMKPDQRHVRYITAFWAGLDLNGDGYSGKDLYFFSKPLAAKAVRSFPLPPSIVVESGVGMHLYWLLQDVVEMVDVQRIENLLNKIGSHFQCKTPTKVDAVLRLPETSNCKVSAQGGLCRVKFINADFRYSLEDFDKLSLRNRQAVAALSAQPGQPEVSPERTLDVAQAHSDEREVSDSEDLLEFLDPSQPVEKKGPVPRPVPVQQPVRTPAPASKDVQQPSALNDFEPLPYETPFERPGVQKEPASRELSRPKPSPEPEAPELGVGEAVVEVVEEQSFDAIADRIVDRVVEKLSEKLMDTMVDQIVQKLAMELTMGGSRGRK